MVFLLPAIWVILEGPGAGFPVSRRPVPNRSIPCAEALRNDGFPAVSWRAFRELRHRKIRMGAPVFFWRVPKPHESHGPLCAFGKFRTHANHMSLCILLSGSDIARIACLFVFIKRAPTWREVCAVAWCCFAKFRLYRTHVSVFGSFR